MAQVRLATRQQRQLLDKILARAKQRGITQDDLAARATLSRETVSRMKKRDADFGTIARLAAVVGYKVDVVEDDDHVEALRAGLLDIGEFGG